MSTETTAFLIVNAPDSLQSADLIHIEWMKPDGALINAKRVISSNGEIEMNLGLSQAGGTSWLVEGIFKGKQVHEVIADGVPSTWLSQASLRMTLLAKDAPVGAEATEAEWLDSDPGRLSAMTVKVVAAIDANTFAMRESVGTFSADLTVDRASGQVTQGAMQLGPAAIKIARLYVQGTP